MEFVTEIVKPFYELFPHCPRTNMMQEDTKELRIHTGHVFAGQTDIVVIPLEGETPTAAELQQFAQQFEEVRAGRAIYSFVGPALSLVKQEGKFGMLSMPVYILRAQITPTVVYRGANNLSLPTYATRSSIGFDIKADAAITLPPNCRAVIKTGLYLDARDWDRNSPCYLRLAPKSGLAMKKGIDVLAGVVDADYPDEIGVMLINHETVEQRFEIGDAIAQGIWEIAVQGGNLPNTAAQRVGGFGSTKQ